MLLADANCSEKITKPKWMILTRPYKRREKHGLSVERLEIWRAGEIAAGKPFLLRTKFGDPKYAPLNQMWSSPDAFLDLPESVSDATQFFQAQEGYVKKKLFWSQFSMPKRPLLLNEQIAQWAKLHRISGSAMKDVLARLWLTEAIPNSYFG